MEAEKPTTLNRRELLTRTAPACALGCLGLWNVPPALASAADLPGQEVHKFDQTQDRTLSVKQLYQMQYSQFMAFIRNVRAEMGDEELIRWLKVHSTAVGRQAGEGQAQQVQGGQPAPGVSRHDVGGSLDHRHPGDQGAVRAARSWCAEGGQHQQLSLHPLS